MHYDLHVPCSNCPFLKKGGIRVTEQRAKMIAWNMVVSQGSTFACHKTTVDHGEGLVEGPSSRHCAGALIFAEKYKNATQMMRIAERLGLYDARKMMSRKHVTDLVFDSVEQMISANRPKRRKKKAH